MKPELIVMLTHHDQTVENALEMFKELKDLPVTHWGFKDVGLAHDQMKQLVKCMKDAGKVTYLEVVSLSEKEGLEGARVAMDAGFDILMGTVYFDSIHKFLIGSKLKYYPFPGHVYGHPSILDGSIDEIVKDALRLEAKGVQGFDLLSYRYTGDARKLLTEVVKATHIPLVSAGSIASFRRIAEVWETKAWGFTIGGAFFEKKFVPNGSFKDNMMAVHNFLEKTQESQLGTYLS